MIKEICRLGQCPVSVGTWTLCTVTILTNSYVMSRNEQTRFGDTARMRYTRTASLTSITTGSRRESRTSPFHCRALSNT